MHVFVNPTLMFVHPFELNVVHILSTMKGGVVQVVSYAESGTNFTQKLKQ